MLGVHFVLPNMLVWLISIKKKPSNEGFIGDKLANNIE